VLLPGTSCPAAEVGVAIDLGRFAKGPLLALSAPTLWVAVSPQLTLSGRLVTGGACFCGNGPGSQL
jgi:hypothetical protein